MEVKQLDSSRVKELCGLRCGQLTQRAGSKTKYNDRKQRTARGKKNHELGQIKDGELNNINQYIYIYI